MKLADLIPDRAGSFGLYGEYERGYNAALARVAAKIIAAETEGYRLVLAMPQHIEPMGEA